MQSHNTLVELYKRMVGRNEVYMHSGIIDECTPVSPNRLDIMDKKFKAKYNLVGKQMRLIIRDYEIHHDPVHPQWEYPMVVGAL